MDISSFADEENLLRDFPDPEGRTPGQPTRTFTDETTPTGTTPALLPPPSFLDDDGDAKMTDTPQKRMRVVDDAEKSDSSHPGDPSFLPSSADLPRESESDADAHAPLPKKRQQQRSKTPQVRSSTRPTKKTPSKRAPPKKAPTKKAPPKKVAAKKTSSQPQTQRPIQQQSPPHPRGRRFSMNSSSKRGVSVGALSDNRAVISTRKKPTQTPKTKSLPPRRPSKPTAAPSKKRRRIIPAQVNDEAIGNFDEFIDFLNELDIEEQMAHIRKRPSLVHFIQDDEWKTRFIEQLEYEKNEEEAFEDQKDLENPAVDEHLEALEQENMNLMARVRELEEEKEEMQSDLVSVTRKSRSGAQTFRQLQSEGRSPAKLFSMKRQHSALKPRVAPRPAPSTTRRSSLNIVTPTRQSAARLLDPESVSEFDLSEHVQDFCCTKHKIRGCTNFLCLVAERPDLIDLVKGSVKTVDYKVGFKADLLSGARTVRFNLFVDGTNDSGSAFNVRTVKRSAESRPMVVTFPLLAMMKRAIDNVSDANEQAELKKCFDLQSEVVYFLIRYPTEPMALLRCLEHAYYQSEQQQCPISDAWSELHQRKYIETELTKCQTERAAKTRQAIYSRQRAQVPTTLRTPLPGGTAPPSTPPHAPSFDAQRPTRALAHWVIELARVPRYASVLFPGYLCCPALQKSTGCPLAVSQCPRVHECTTCHVYGHGQASCPQKSKPPKSSRFSSRPVFPR